MLKIEVLVYILIALFLFAIRRVISGMKNGCFYGKNSNPLPEKLLMYIKNIHFLETPAWYSQFGGVFFMLMAILRTDNSTFDLHVLFIQFTAAMCMTMGSSAMASYHFQGYINTGAGLPWVDPKENKKSEFAINFFGKKISYWWNRPWYGERRKYTPFLGFLTIVIGIFILKFL